jgi:hypothetical protein
MSDIRALLEPIQRLHNTIRDTIVERTDLTAIEELVRVDRETESDTIYTIDSISENILIDFLENEIANQVPIVLVAEGLPEGKIVLPRGSVESDAIWRIIIDPIDGTRGLMYQKRSAWILTGVAPNRGANTNLQDIELAVQTEIPLVKQYLTDTLWAIKGETTKAQRYNRLTGEVKPLNLKPSTADTIRHGFVTVSRYFPGAGDELVAIEEKLIRETLGPVQHGKAHSFEDQYISSGGQLYELMAGHDRFVADLRPLIESILVERGAVLGLCAHPYDLCTELIARQLGVIVTDAQGNSLCSPLDTTTEIDWIGYANLKIREQIEPTLQSVLKDRGLWHN